MGVCRQSWCGAGDVVEGYILIHRLGGGEGEETGMERGRN